MTGPFSEGPSPGGRLRFILRTALPHLPQLDLGDVADLFDLPEGQRLIILAGTDQRLIRTVRFQARPGGHPPRDAPASSTPTPPPAIIPCLVIDQ